MRHLEELELGGLDEAIRLSLTVAAAYYEQGDADYAARLCQRAIDRAEAIASPVAKAMAYWNSSAIESMRGNASTALPMTRRALAVIEATDDARNIARLRTQLGILQLLLDPPQPREALEVLTRAAEELALTDAGPADLADNRLAQARARFLLGDVECARRQATEIGTAVRSNMPLLAADSFALLGQIAVQEAALDTGSQPFPGGSPRCSAASARIGRPRNFGSSWPGCSRVSTNPPLHSRPTVAPQRRPGSWLRHHARRQPRSAEATGASTTPDGLRDSRGRRVRGPRMKSLPDPQQRKHSDDSDQHPARTAHDDVPLLRLSEWH